MSIPIHRCRFMDYERPGISAMAFNEPSLGPKSPAPLETRLAIGRSNGEIEIWNTVDFVCDTVIPGARGRTVDDLCWIKSGDEYRLFSVGGTDTIVEWDLGTGLPLQFVRSDAGTIWAMSASPDQKQLAVSTENGSVVIFNVNDEQLEFSKRLSGADASLVSVTWQSGNEIVAGGSDGKVRVWNVQQGRIVVTLRVDKQRVRAKHGSSNSGEDTVVWTVLALPRTSQLVSGDSNGFVKIWDTKTWSLQQSLQSHEGDVLCLAANYNGTSLFSSGLDQKIINTRLTDPKIRRWTVMNSSVAHTHDIRCMSSFETGKFSLLVSGGLEPNFVVSDMQHFISRPHRKVATARFKPRAELVGNFVVEWNEQNISIWQLQENNRKLKAKLKLSGDDFITSASFDPELGLLAVGTLYALKLFFIEGSQIAPVPLPGWEGDAGVQILKWAEPEKLVIVTDENKCLTYDPSSGSSVLVVDEPPREVGTKLAYTNNIALLAVSNGLIAVARHNRYIDIYTTTGKPVSTLPMQSAEITALQFRTPQSIVVATADREVTEFDVTSGQLTQWSRLNQGRMPQQLLTASEPAHGIFPGVGKSDRAWLWGPSWLATIDFSSTRPLLKRKHRDAAKHDEDEDDDDEVDAAVIEDENSNSDDLPAFWMCHKFKPIFYAGAVGNGLLVSEKPDTTMNARRMWTNRRINV